MVKKSLYLGLAVGLVSISLYAQQGSSKNVTANKKVTTTKKVALEKQFPSVPGQLSVSAIYGQVSKDREELKALREKYMQEYQQKGVHSNCIQLTGNITQATIQYVVQRIADTVKKLGPAPTQFSVFTMGSMARNESGFFTDLELGILVAQKNVASVNYFKRFSQVLADRFFLLGEHPDVGGKGLRIDEGGNAPEHLFYWARYASPKQADALLAAGVSPYEGSRIYMATPDEFAQLMRPHLLKYLVDMSDSQKNELFKNELAKAKKDVANKGLSQAELAEKVWSGVNALARPLTQQEKDLAFGAFAVARNMRHIYGNKRIFDQYMAARNRYLQGPPEDATYHPNRREELAYALLNFDVEKHGKAGSAITTGKLGDIVNVKGLLYRFPEEILTSLGFLYNVGVQNTAHIADKLVATKHMSVEWANALKDLMNFTLCLRLRKQIKLGKQGYDIPVTQKGHNELKQKLSQELAALRTEIQSLQKAKADQRVIDQKQDQMLVINQNILDLSKLVPGKADSIITPEIITLLNTKYLPLEKKLLETTRKFIQGDKNAFLEKIK